MAERFEFSHTDTKLTFNFGGSQQLAQSIRAGAPADVFASADEKQMKVAVDAGSVSERNVREFAQNQLVLVVYPGSKVKSFEDLAKPGVRIVMAAKEVPAGKYSFALLDKLSDKASFRQSVMKNVVSYELDVRSVLRKVQLGEGDVGFVYRTDAKSAGRKIRVVDFPSDLNVTAHYYIAPCKGKNGVDASAFVDYVLSPAGQAALGAHGFMAHSHAK